MVIGLILLVCGCISYLWRCLVSVCFECSRFVIVVLLVYVFDCVVNSVVVCVLSCLIYVWFYVVFGLGC